MSGETKVNAPKGWCDEFCNWVFYVHNHDGHKHTKCNYECFTGYCRHFETKRDFSHDGILLNKDTSKEDLDRVNKWDGWIDREGKFYPTKPRYAQNWMGSSNLHRDWADEYVGYELQADPDDEIRKLEEEGKLERRELSGCKDYIVHVAGWVSFGYSLFFNGRVYLQTPNPDYVGVRVTKEQVEAVRMVLELNGDDMGVYEDIKWDHYPKGENA